MPAHYDDPSFSYERYWKQRRYEHLCEEMAINNFLNGQKFIHAVDLGGGYGRLTSLIAGFAAQTTLIEPSTKQRKIAKSYLKKNKRIGIMSGTAQKTGLPDSSANLLVCVRVMHHLPDPLPALTEFYRILAPGGELVLEFANSFHFKARIKSLFTGQPILTTPIERRSKTNIRLNTIPFVNHHPLTITKQLKQTGFEINRVISVSNFRSSFLKRSIPFPILVFLEKISQKLLASSFFGPSIFILARKP